ncbi:MAG TPA: hemerythrin domain-containing protein [Kofleriaceae bacterium]|nr:hemerythrin domain-containing protein [Kofleriaceae bacterium]
MNALTLLKQQHDEVDELFAALEDAAGAEKLQLFEELADKLAAHATVEEQLFYPRVKMKETAEILVESTEEHLSVKRLLADLLEMDADDDRFDAKISVMKEQIEHHARDEEEKELFPKVRKLMTAANLDELGAEMLALFEQLLQEEPRLKVPAETDVAAPV